MSEAAAFFASQPQSALHPAGPVAESIFGVTGVLVLGAAAIFLLVMALLWIGLRRHPGPVPERTWVIGGGIAFPAVVLIALFAYSEHHKPPHRTPPPPDALIVGVTGHMWWWEVRYRDPATGTEVVGANEIHIPVGRPIYFGLSSADVIHSFWVPSLGGKMDALPGRMQHLLLQADRPGVFRGQCAEYCGTQHALMALHVVAQEPAAFDAWLAAQAKPAVVVADGSADAGARSEGSAPDPLARGRSAFVEHRCNSCHTVRGVATGLSLGPDLTHVGSRLFLGAGTVRNNPAQLADWIAQTQQLKPGVRMPSGHGRIDPTDTQAIAAWLSQLK